jgi:hypothetical protein
MCRSPDGGNNFVPVMFPNPPNPATDTESPYVILFTGDKNGIAAWANDLEAANSAYIYYTADGGATWTLATMPTMASQFALTNGFAAPDGQHIWVGGFTNDSTPKLVLWKSTDGGKTWKDVSAALTAANAGAMDKLHSGFALDATNIWVGGDNGGLAYSPTGGEMTDCRVGPFRETNWTDPVSPPTRARVPESGHCAAVHFGEDKEW